mgnify:CR=1 FL=1
MQKNESAEDNKGQTYTRVKNVPLSSTHLGIVAEVNDLSRQITGGYITLENAVEQLKIIEDMPEEIRPNILQAYNGVFNSIVTHVPAEYETVEYEVSTTYFKRIKPVWRSIYIHQVDTLPFL